MATGRVYTVPLDAISVTNSNDQDIFLLATASTKVAVLHAISLTSSYTTDERVRLQLLRRTTAGSGGTGGTVTALDAGNAIAAASSVTYLRTTPGTAGAYLAGWQWSQQGEFLYLPTPEDRPLVAVSSYLALHLATAMGGTRTWSGYIKFEEL